MAASRGIETAGDAREEGGVGVGIPPPAFYVAGFLAGIALELVFPIDALPVALAIVAGVLGAMLWMALDGRAMLHFRRAGTGMAPTKPTTALVTSGPYRVTRNPMYLGMAFLYIGLALALGIVWALAVLPAVLLIVDRLVIVREERDLEARFGEQYREYRKRVRRWL